MKITLSRHDSPIDPLFAARSPEGLHALWFSAGRDDVGAELRAYFAKMYPSAVCEEGEDPTVARALADYFGGDLLALDALPVAAKGTDFQHRVWAALRAIPAGATLSYGALAVKLGKAAAVRAVGMANARNPIAVVVPCHRVIASTGALQGYAGGLWRKEWLLAHEKAVLV
jgi:O-6-methylguanine DNA methyltransferase